VAYAAGTVVVMSEEKGDDRDTKERVMASRVADVAFPIRSTILSTSMLLPLLMLTK
jgi:hypothetical protein